MKTRKNEELYLQNGCYLSIDVETKSAREIILHVLFAHEFTLSRKSTN